MTTPVGPPDSMSQYSGELLAWAGKYPDDARDRLTAMLGKMTLAVLAKMQPGAEAESAAHPTKPNVNVFYFQLKNGNWYCFVLESDPADMGAQLQFSICDSTGSKGKRAPGSQLAVLNSNMSTSDISAALP